MSVTSGTGDTGAGGKTCSCSEDCRDKIFGVDASDSNRVRPLNETLAEAAVCGVADADDSAEPIRLPYVYTAKNTKILRL